jgi:hypothetical protein
MKNSKNPRAADIAQRSGMVRESSGMVEQHKNWIETVRLKYGRT